MIARILTISELDSNCVVFETAIGRGVARWAGKRFNPVVGAEYDVEFELGVALDPGITAKRTYHPRPFLAVRNARVAFNALIEAIDEDGMTYLRLSEDCLIMADANPGVARTGDWWEFEIGPHNFRMFAIGA